MPVQLIHITLQYSNAVLLATLPHISDFAKKLDIPIPIPVTTNNVQKFQPQRTFPDVGGWLTLTNGYQFWYERGVVHIFDSPRNFYSAQDPDKTPQFFGNLNMTKKEALELAQNSIKRLGYADKKLTEGLELQISEPPHMGTNIIPFYRFEWVDPKDTESAYVHIEIDAENKQLAGLYYTVRAGFEKPFPKIDVPVELESDYRKRMQGQTNLIFQTNVPQKLPKEFQKTNGP